MAAYHNSQEQPELSREELLILSQAQERLIEERVARGINPGIESLQNLYAIRRKLQRFGGHSS